MVLEQRKSRLRVRDKKENFRCLMGLLLKNFPRDARVEKSLRISLLLKDLMGSQKGLLWGVFSPLGDEPLWDICMEPPPPFELAFPRFQGPGRMVFVKTSKEKLVESDAFGVSLSLPT